MKSDEGCGVTKSPSFSSQNNTNYKGEKRSFMVTESEWTLS